LTFHAIFVGSFVDKGTLIFLNEKVFAERAEEVATL
jgi:hypothetical protein